MFSLFRHAWPFYWRTVKHRWNVLGLYPDYIFFLRERHICRVQERFRFKKLRVIYHFVGFSSVAHPPARLALPRIFAADARTRAVYERSPVAVPWDTTAACPFRPELQANGLPGTLALPFENWRIVFFRLISNPHCTK